MRELKPTRAVPKGLTCTNCETLLGGQVFAFEEIFLCHACHLIAVRLVDNCRRDLDKTLDVYKRILVAAAKEKGLHLPNAETKAKTAVHDTV
jgi:hypothetical protein